MGNPFGRHGRRSQAVAQATDAAPKTPERHAIADGQAIAAQRATG